MGYFITGATGFIGRHVVAELVGRGARIWVLVRPGSEAKFERWCASARHAATGWSRSGASWAPRCWG